MSTSPHIANHHIDLCITERDSGLFQSISKGHLISDHNFIHVKLRAPKPYVSPKRISYRKHKYINHDLFKTDLSTNLTEGLNSISDQSAWDLVKVYSNACTKTLNQHTPVKEKVVRPIHNQPWFDDNIRKEMQLCRKNKALLYRDPCTYTFQAFYNQRHYCANLIRSSQSPTTMTSSEKTNKVTKPSPISQTVYLVKVTIFPYHQPETWNPWLKIAVCFLVTKLTW